MWAGSTRPRRNDRGWNSGRKRPDEDLDAFIDPPYGPPPRRTRGGQARSMPPTGFMPFNGLRFHPSLSDSSMTITDLVAPEAILPALKVNSKKQALQELAARAAELTGQNERAIFEVLLRREKLGTTAVGYGVAIPHGKLPKLEKLFGLFARLERPIDFEAMDGQPVDLVFLLLAPEGAGADHLKAL